MKKERIIFIISLITIIISSIISVYAASYLYNSNEVSYNNTSSGISSDNVQGAIDELYTQATNYSSFDTRVTSLETKVGEDTLTTTAQDLSGAVNELKSDLLKWKFAGQVTNSNKLVYPSDANELLCVVAWTSDLTYGYTIHIPLNTENTSTVYRSGAYSTNGDGGSIVIRLERNTHSVYIGSVYYNGSEWKNTKYMRVHYR